ncbi:MAG: response regulator transcription factor [Candidatus Cyclobacteriaceae bacterium M3_2C_046]
MHRIAWIFGIFLFLLVLLLKSLEYNYFLANVQLELYLLMVGLISIGLGLLLGKNINQIRHKKKQKEDSQKGLQQMRVPPELSKREFEVLQLMSQGYSNQEIADQLYVSIHTVKSHSTNLFSKLAVKRRTQAIQKAKQYNWLT